MARRNLLPGVADDGCPPAVVVDSRRIIGRARRRAAAYDAAQLILLAGLDWLFVRWPYAHVPFADRDMTFFVMAGLNAAVVSYAIVSRMFPRWTARRIATTWCLAERARFFAASRHEPARQ